MGEHIHILSYGRYIYKSLNKALMLQCMQNIMGHNDSATTVGRKGSW
jgi:hypothetical protein